jgi:electron transfer flavoprotein alpha/beta subunit
VWAGRLNEPRYAKLPEIMVRGRIGRRAPRRASRLPDPDRAVATLGSVCVQKAKKKPIQTETPASLGVDVAPRLTYTQVVDPPVRKAGVKVADVDDLLKKLKTAGAV